MSFLPPWVVGLSVTTVLALAGARQLADRDWAGVVLAVMPLIVGVVWESHLKPLVRAGAQPEQRPVGQPARPPMPPASARPRIDAQRAGVN